MPTYENKCERCGHEFESVQSIKEETHPTCPRCGGTTKRLISRGNFHLRGKGWAKDRYASGK